MKRFTVLALIVSLLSVPVLADQTSCEVSRKNLLSDDLLKQLTVKVCPPESTSDSEIYTKYNKKYETLTAREFLVYQYTDMCYEKINRELYKTTDQNPEILQLTEQLDAVLCDYPKSIIEVFRGANLPESAVQNYLDAEEISFPAFVSTSTEHKVGCEFAQNGNTLLKMISKSGRAIEKNSEYQEESEVLFRTNVRFKVTLAMSGFRARVISGCKGIKYYFELEEINSEDETKPVWPFLNVKLEE